MHRTGARFSRDDNLIQREPLVVARALVPVPDDPAVQHHPLFDDIVVRDEFFQNPGDFFVAARHREIAEVPEVDADQRHTAPGEPPRRANQRPVAAECQHAVVVFAANPRDIVLFDVDQFGAEREKLLPDRRGLLRRVLLAAVQEK